MKKMKNWQYLIKMLKSKGTGIIDDKKLTNAQLNIK